MMLNYCAIVLRRHIFCSDRNEDLRVYLGVTNRFDMSNSNMQVSQLVIPGRLKDIADA